MEPALTTSSTSTTGDLSPDPHAIGMFASPHHGTSGFEKVYSKEFSEPSPTAPYSDEELMAAEEGRHSWLRPKLNIGSSPRIYWEAFQAMRQVGQSETRRMSDAEVQQLCSPK